MKPQDIQRKIILILKKEGVRKAELFGSYARGEANRRSDVDILVELAPHTTLFDFVGIKLQLEEILGKRVDLVTYRSINPKLRKYIMQDRKLLYGKEL